MKKFVVLAVAAAIAGAIFFSPHYAYYRLEKAVVAHDVATIAEYVDFPAVRESVHAQSAVAIPARLRDITTNEKFAAAAEQMAINMLYAKLEETLTPETFGQLDEKVGSRYASPSRFEVVTRSRKDDERTKLILVRHGLRWKLAGIEFPPYKPKSPAAAAALARSQAAQLEKQARAPQASGADQGFEGLQLDSDEAAILAKFGSRVQKYTKQESFPTRYVDLSIPEFAIGGVPMEVLFQMDVNTRRLDQVVARRFSRTSPSMLYDKDFDGLTAFFSAKYGQPQVRRDPYLTGSSISRQHTWVNGATTIEVSHTALKSEGREPLWEDLTVRFFP